VELGESLAAVSAAAAGKANSNPPSRTNIIVFIRVSSFQEKRGHAVRAHTARRRVALNQLENLERPGRTKEKTFGLRRETADACSGTLTYLWT
jgi:hypothetical protein